MDENKTDLDEISNQFLIQSELKSLLFSSKLSDVSFLIKDELIYAHKFPLVLASPVFEKMFYGDLKMDTTKSIEITDITAIGFKNVLKYIYTNKIDFEFIYFYDTYLVADKYLIHHMIKALINYFKSKLNELNCCTIYDHILNFPSLRSLPLDYVKKFIAENTQKAFESKYFTEIQPATLINLLDSDRLNISELDLLKACLRYVNANVRALENDSSQESKRKLFGQFKKFIRFGDLDPKDLAFCGIYDLLTEAEISSLFLHLHNPEMLLNFKCSTQRKSNIIYSVSFSCKPSQSITSLKERLVLKVNQNVSIKNIHTTIPSENKRFDLSMIIENQKNDLKLVIKKFVLDGKWSFKFKSFDIQPDTNYLLVFQKVPSHDSIIKVSNSLTSQFEKDQKYFIFNLFVLNNTHCIKKIDFLIP